MPYQSNEDNIYQVGSIIQAKEAPTLNLIIRKYYQRIYYCLIAGDESAKEKVYFEKELLAPAKL